MKNETKIALAKYIIVTSKVIDELPIDTSAVLFKEAVAACDSLIKAIEADETIGSLEVTL